MMNVHRSFNPWIQVPLWAAGSALAGAVIGVTVGFFRGGTVEAPILIISVLFGLVVGLTAMLCSVVLFPRLGGLPPALRLVLLGLALLSGAIAGTFAVLTFYPLFVFREPRLAAAVVAINAVVALIVGAMAFAYEGMRLRLEASLREIEEVRLVEAHLREEAARSELAALQARINPHFFFNTLNTIAFLIDEDPDEAGEVVQRLADLFRYAFRVSDAGPIPAREEIEFTRGYLEIEQARFGERLCVEWNLEDEALSVLVPGMVLQPLVENAVGHGIAPRAAGGKLRIAARIEADALILDVVDDGIGLKGGGAGLITDGHGLGNVTRRLDVFYGGGAWLELRDNPDGTGTLARLVLPTLDDDKHGRDSAPVTEVRR